MNPLWHMLGSVHWPNREDAGTPSERAQESASVREYSPVSGGRARSRPNAWHQLDRSRSGQLPPLYTYYHQRCALEAWHIRLEHQEMNRDEDPLPAVYNPLICQAQPHAVWLLHLFHISIPLCMWMDCYHYYFKLFTTTIAWNWDVTITCHYCLAHPHPLSLFPPFKCM